MSSSDRRIVAARKTEEGPKDTWPAPPPSSEEEPFSAEMGRDTVPTPPPESGIADVPIIPPLREVDLETDPDSDSDPA
ncbi:MAG TPA: hypothetical protein VGI39_35480 [Polyangiaceae bacterium]|jgi:hypothetical protein